MIMNGVCVMWRGWIDLKRLDGIGCLEYDEVRAAEEDAYLQFAHSFWRPAPSGWPAQGLNVSPSRV